MNYNSHKTAISRKSLPTPVRWLLDNGLVKGSVLDYGCGKCKEINNEFLSKHPQVKSVYSFDPHFSPSLPPQSSNFEEGWYDVIICTYVLCTLPESEDKNILRDIQKRLKPNGVAYITVRTDEPDNGYGFSSRGTFQRKVELPYLEQVRKCNQYRIYRLTPQTNLL